MTGDRAAILRRIVDIARDRISLDGSLDDVGEATGLLGEGLGVDSIGVMQLVLGIEAEFDVFVEDDELSAAQFRTLGDVVDLVERLQGHGEG